jgi:hypothetical protein
MNKFGRSRKTLQQQIFAMKAAQPDFSCSFTRRRAVWTGVLQPTPLSQHYRVKIDYTFLRFPKVYVLEPALPEKVPHRYADGRLCLYYPSYEIWSSEYLIAHTIIPWTAHWLWWYEMWLLSDKKIWFAEEYQHRGEKREAG